MQFAVTWDYRCPFARNAHEHLVLALRAGAPWEVTFRPFLLEKPDDWRAVPPANYLALAAGVVVQDRHPDQFLAAHAALFSARHDQARDLRQPAAIAEVLDAVGLPGEKVVAEVQDGWPLESIRTSHEAAVRDHEVFGVPTFIIGSDAVFVRLMNRPNGDAELARSTVQQVLDLMTGHRELNEFKYTRATN